MRICSASPTSSRERSVNLRDAPMVRTEVSGADHANDCCWGHSLVLQFCIFAAVVLYQRLMPDNQEPTARYAGLVDRAA